MPAALAPAGSIRIARSPAPPSRAGSSPPGRHLENGAITESQVTNAVIEKVKKLNAIAKERGQTLAQMAIAWVLKDKRITSVILGASKPKQVTDSIGAIKNYNFSEEELAKIDAILAGK